MVNSCTTRTMDIIGSIHHDEENSSGLLLFTNCRISEDNNQGVLRPGHILVDVSSGTIEKVMFCSSTRPHENGTRITTIDCGGNIISPGFIDIQINGAHGVDFSSPNLTQEDVIKVKKLLPKYGVTSFCPTLISSSQDIYKRNIAILNKFCNNQGEEEGAKILGLHLEGPFFAKSKRGAHNSNFIQETVSSELMSNIYCSHNLRNDHVRIITMAPELPGALSSIKSLSDQGIIVSMGHTDATFSNGMDGIANGATLITHLFNAMKPFHHREPGLIGLISKSNRDKTDTRDDEKKKLPQKQSFVAPYFSIIVDGEHSHPAAVRMAYELDFTKLILVTDAMSAMGFGSGTHSLGSMTVTIDGNKAVLANSNTLAGSIISMDNCVRNLKQFSGCSTNDALKAATLHPARLLKCDNAIGSLCPGTSADLVLLDENLNVLKTWINGREVFDMTPHQ